MTMTKEQATKIAVASFGTVFLCYSKRHDAWGVCGWEAGSVNIEFHNGVAS